MTPLVTTFAGDSARGEGLFSSAGFIRPAVAMYTANQGNNSISKINLTSFTSTNTLALGAGVGPQWIAIDPIGQFGYVACPYNNTLKRIDLTTFTVSATLSMPASSYPVSAVVDPTNTSIYTANQTNATVSKISVASFTVVSSLTLSGTVSTITINPAGTLLYVGYGTGPYLQTITVSTFATATAYTYGASGTVNQIAISPNNDYLYGAYGNASSQSGYTRFNIGTSTYSGFAGGFGDYDYGVAIDPAGTYAFITRNSISDLKRYPIAGGAATTTSLPQLGGAICIDTTGTNGYLYYTNFNQIQKFTCSTLALSTTLTTTTGNATTCLVIA